MAIRPATLIDSCVLLDVITGDQQWHFRQMLHAIDEARALQRIGLRHNLAVGKVHQNQAADVFLRDQPDEFTLIASAAKRIFKNLTSSWVVVGGSL